MDCPNPATQPHSRYVFCSLRHIWTGRMDFGNRYELVKLDKPGLFNDADQSVA